MYHGNTGSLGKFTLGLNDSGKAMGNLFHNRSIFCFVSLLIHSFVRGTRNLHMIFIFIVYIRDVHVFYSFTNIYDSANDVNTVIQFLITLRIFQKSFLNLMHCCTILEIEHNENLKSKSSIPFSPLAITRCQFVRFC
jgi:hypothetical protein